MFSTRRMRVVLGVTLALALAAPASLGWLFRTRIFLGDASLDHLTFAAPSHIPGAGDGLFAAEDLKRGQIFAEMGGQLVLERRVKHRGYLFTIPACGAKDLWPYDALDGTTSGGHASKANFAPRRINGVDTNFQNAQGLFVCHRPYVAFQATRDIPKGTEIFIGYGAEYDYDFMQFDSVKAYFCEQAHVDCSAAFTWEP
jgi:hypothetical protein